jgi:hypothetical protein
VATLREYYSRLQEFEGEAAVELIAPWQPQTVEAIRGDFAAAIDSGVFRGSTVRIPAGTSNQSIGNKVADFAATRVDTVLKHFRIESCSGAGYPDRVLRSLAHDSRYPAELKATSAWDPADSNRRVITSSSAKLRRQFNPPINHLLITFSYTLNTVTEQASITAVRMDFVEPDTIVNIRLEASVSHRLLSGAKHRHFTLRCEKPQQPR